MSNKFIIRVDDVGQLPDQSKPDVGLRYFKSWHRACGWEDTPMYLGVVPGVMSDEDIGLAREHVERYGGELCIHGYDHARGVLSYDDVMRASAALPGARCVIPPFNAYDDETLRATAALGRDPVLFGGLSSDPPAVTGDGVLHLAAEPSLYEHSYKLVSALSQLGKRDYPLVMTFHHRWDHEAIGRASSVVTRVRRDVVTVDAAWGWARRTT